MSASVFCVRCGYPNVQGYAYCPSCGNPVYTPPAAAAPPPAVTPPPSAPPAYPAGPAYPPPVYPPPYGYGYGYYPRPPKRASVSRMLEDTFHVFSRDLFVYVGVLLLVGLLSTGATLLLTWLGFGVASASPNPAGTSGLLTTDLVVRTLLIVFVLALLSAVIDAIVASTLTHFAVQRYRGTPERLGEAFAHGLGRFLSVLGARILIGLLVAVTVSVPIALLIVGGLTGNLALVGLGALLIIVLGVLLVYLYVGLILYLPAIVMEGQGALAGLQRSWALTRGHRLDLFLALVILLIIVGAVAGLIGIVSGIGNNVYVVAVGSILASAVTGSWLILFTSVGYHLISTEPPAYAAPPPYAYAPPAPPR